MPKRVDIIITGAGSLATEILHGLASSSADGLEIALLGRDPDRLAALARSGEELAEGRLKVRPVALDWSDDGLLRRLIAELHPKVLVHTASVQSPWTLAGADSWARLVQDAGFGLTTPLQALLTLRVARALLAESAETALVNGCYPDAVNRVLFFNGLSGAAGLGNIAILAALLSQGLPASMTEGKQLRLVAHHAHLAAVHEKRSVNPAMRVWLDEEPIDQAAAVWLNDATLAHNLNSVTGPIAAPMLLALAKRIPLWRGHSPGPVGLPGGYPIVIDNGDVQVDLPRNITLAEASNINMTAGLADGLMIDDTGQVRLSEPASEALARTAPDEARYFSSWHASEVEDQALRWLALRERLGGEST